MSLTGLSLGILGYTHVGYPALIAVLARLSPHKTKVDPTFEPMVSVCVPAHNAAQHIAAKLETLVQQTYPADKIEILVYSDGSTDGTEEIVRAQARRDPRIRLLRGEVCRGKPTALNYMRDVARGEVLVLTDARQTLVPGAVRALVEGLSDPDVACVSGNLVLQGQAGSGFYWKYENWIRKNESRFRSMVGVTGPLTALRKVDLHPVPEDIILDDIWVPMRLRLDGRRVLLREDAIAYDQAFADTREFQRKVRTLAGNYQVFARMPRLLSPFSNPSWLETMSHKIMRLVSPFALIALFASTATSLAPGPMPYKTLKQVLFAAQLLAYGAAAVGPRAGRVPGIARTFVVMHVAALVGLWRYLTGAQKVTWLLPANQAAGQGVRPGVSPTPAARPPAISDAPPAVSPAAAPPKSAPAATATLPSARDPEV